MTELWLLCPHGLMHKHWWPAPLDEDENCPGGHVATVEEVYGWLAEQEIRKASQGAEDV